MRQQLIIIVFSLGCIACGQEQYKHFRGGSVNNSSDQITVLSGDLNDQGEIMIANQLVDSWDGKALLGNQRYDVMAID